MTKRKRDAIEEDEDEEELQALFVDTSLDTHFMLSVSPRLSFSLLKEQIVMRHSKLFPDFGEIKIDALKVKRGETYYDSDERLLLGKAFRGIGNWFVFAYVIGTPFSYKPVEVKSISDQRPQPLPINCKHGSNHTMPCNVSMTQENGLNICSDVDQMRGKRERKKLKCEATAVEALASSSPAENAHMFDYNNTRETSLLINKPLMPCSNGDAIEPKQLDGRKDGLQKDKAASSNDLPSKVVETSTGAETKKKKNKYGDYNIADHVQDASSVSTDAVAKTDKTNGSPELLGNNMEGKGSGAHNAEDKLESREKRSKKKKKRRGDGVENKLSNDTDIVEDTPAPALTNGSKVLLSEQEAVNLVERAVVNEEDAAPLISETTEAVNLVERAAVNEEAVPPLKPPVLQITESENYSKRKKSKKSKSSCKEKQELSNKKENDHLESTETRQKGGTFTEVGGVDYTEAACGSPDKNTKLTSKKDVDGVNESESHVAQPDQVTDVIQDGVTAMDGENLICERESDDKRTAEEGVMEPTESGKRKKKRKTKTPAALKQDLPSLGHNIDQEGADSKQQAEEVSQPADISKPEQARSKRKAHLQESSECSSKELLNEKEMAALQTVIDDCLKGNKTNDHPDQSQVDLDELKTIPAPLVSATAAEETIVDKPKASNQQRKESKQNERTSQAVETQLVAAGTGQIGLELLQPARSSKPEESIELSSVKPKKRSKSKRVSSVIDAPEILVTDQIVEEKQPHASLTNANGNAVEHKKGLSLPEEHYNDAKEILTQDVLAAEKMKPENQPESTQKVKKSDKSTSVDTNSKQENLTVSYNNSGNRNMSLDGGLSKPISVRDSDKKPQSSVNKLTMEKKVTDTKLSEVENNPVTKSGVQRSNMNDRNGSSGTSSFISGSSAKRAHLGNELKEVKKKNIQEHKNAFKTPATKNVGKPSSTLPQKKHLSATKGFLFGDISSDSSDDEFQRNGSIESTKTPDDSSSSDYSEGESKGEVVTPQQGSGSAREKTNLNVSGLKDMNLETILRNSSRYKKAKLAASQTPVEDIDES